MREKLFEDASDVHAPQQLALWLSDIEGSTRLLEAHGEDYIAALQSHRSQARRACQTHGGRLVETRGDSLFAVFPGASAALACTRELRDHWEDDPVGNIALRVRFGLHFGELVPLESGFAGLDLHLAARVCDAAHGGQILASAAFVEALNGDGAPFRSLGQFALRGLNAPCHLMELPSERTPTFPPPRTLDTHAGTLRSPIDAFVGRRHELERLDALLRGGTRLVSVCGAGGVGKSRLALQWARGQRGEFPDGAYWVDLATIEGTPDPDEAARRIALAVLAEIGLPDDSGAPAERVGAWLQAWRVLLLLDNCEHLLEGVPVVAGWLEGAPGLCVVATSRETLHLRGESVLRLEPLAPPTDDSPAALETSDAARLLLGRVSENDGDWHLSPTELPFVARLCRRLDGLPLALELVAPHLREWGATATLEELERGGALAFSGPRDAHPRHRTLAEVVRWSYGGLSDAAKATFRALGTFAGGAAREALLAVSGQPPATLGALTDRYLAHGGRDGRLHLLETLREFALHEASADGEGDWWRRRHAEYFAAYVEREDTAALAQGNDEANFRLALEFWRDHDARRMARMVVRLTSMWEWRALFREGRAWIETALFLLPADDDLRLPLHAALGEMAFLLADFSTVESAVKLVMGASPQGVAGAEMLATTRLSRGFVRLYRQDYEHSERDFHAAAALFDALGDDAGVAAAVGALGVVRLNRNSDLEGALDLYHRAIARAHDHADTLAISTFYVGDALGPCAGRWEEARPFFDRALELARAARHPTFEGYALWGLGGTEREAGRLDLVRGYNARVARFILEYGHGWAAPYFIEACAHLAIVEGDAENAATLLGAAHAIREAIEVPLSLEYCALYNRMETRMAELADAATLAAARDRGAELEFTHALQLAVSVGTDL